MFSERFVGLGVLSLLGVGNGITVEMLAIRNPFLSSSGVTGWRLMWSGMGWSVGSSVGR